MNSKAFISATLVLLLAIGMGCSGGGTSSGGMGSAGSGSGGGSSTSAMVGTWNLSGSNGANTPQQITFNPNGTGTYSGSALGSGTCTWTLAGNQLTVAYQNGDRRGYIMNFQNNNNWMTWNGMGGDNNNMTWGNNSGPITWTRV